MSSATGTTYARVVFSHVLLQEGQDPGAAAESLRAILRLDPGHAEARRNLAVLLRQRAGNADRPPYWRAG